SVMRRTLFHKTVEVHPPVYSSVREVLLFDIRDQSNSADQTLAERRLGAWTFGPWLVLAGHVAVIVSLLLDRSARLSWDALARPSLPLIGSLALDVVAGLVVLAWRRLQLAPHTVVRLMCGYIAATGILWTTACAAAGSSQLASASFVTIAMASGFFLRSIIAVPSPPLAVASGVVAVIGAALFSPNLQAAF